MKIEIKNLKFFPAMSEETNAIVCDIFVDGKKVAYVKNDGHGGSTDYNAYPGKREELQAAEKHALTLPDYEYEYQGTKLCIKQNLESLIDQMVSDILTEKETAKYKKKLERDCLGGICIKVPNGHNTISWRNYTLQQLLNTPVGKVMVQKKVDELIANGEKILNTNLVGINM